MNLQQEVISSSVYLQSIQMMSHIAGLQQKYTNKSTKLTTYYWYQALSFHLIANIQHLAYKLLLISNT